MEKPNYETGNIFSIRCTKIFKPIQNLRACHSWFLAVSLRMIWSHSSFSSLQLNRYFSPKSIIPPVDSYSISNLHKYILKKQTIRYKVAWFFTWLRHANTWQKRFWPGCSSIGADFVTHIQQSLRSSNLNKPKIIAGLNYNCADDFKNWKRSLQ